MDLQFVQPDYLLASTCGVEMGQRGPNPNSQYIRAPCIDCVRPVPRSGSSPPWLRRLFADNPQFTSESSVLGLETVA
jgi:hypothetical protein